MERITEVKRTEGGGVSVYGEYDLLEYMRRHIARKIEVDGEKALELALAEFGYVKERTCTIVNVNPEDGIGHCSECDGIVSKLFDSYCGHCGARVVK